MWRHTRMFCDVIRARELALRDAPTDTRHGRELAKHSASHDHETGIGSMSMELYSGPSALDSTAINSKRKH